MTVTAKDTEPLRGSSESRNSVRQWLHAARTPLSTAGAVAVLLLLWQFLPVIFNIPAVILPPFSTVIATLIEDFPSLTPDVVQTATEAVVGFGLAVVIGIPLGIWIVFSRFAHDTIYPLLVASQMVPKIAIAPIFLVWFGLGIGSKLALAFTLAIFPIVINTTLGMGLVGTDQERLMQSMRAKRLQTFLRLRLPVAAPTMFVGLKLGMAQAVVGAIVGEYIAANQGLGYYILFQNGQLNTAAVYAGVILIAIVGVILYFAVEVCERYASPQRRSQRRSRHALAA